MLKKLFVPKAGFVSNFMLLLIAILVGLVASGCTINFQYKPEMACQNAENVSTLVECLEEKENAVS